jgi:hypothetical protein
LIYVKWNVYVDLPANSVRYCFRTIADASAFKQRFVHAQEERAVAGRHRLRLASSNRAGRPVL